MHECNIKILLYTQSVLISGELSSDLGQNEPYNYEIYHIQMMNSETLTEIQITHGHSVLQYVYSVEVCHKWNTLCKCLKW